MELNNVGWLLVSLVDRLDVGECMRVPQTDRQAPLGLCHDATVRGLLVVSILFISMFAML